jgi:DtxR family transcriptional regulator, Mn-dependent transcriptional regulator
VASSTVEDYVKQIYTLQRHAPRGQWVAPGQVAAAAGVVPGTATTMLKSLADAGLVDYESRTGVRLTRTGEKLALSVLRRHRLIELFLVRVLDVDWADVHDDAERLEHALSDKLVERIDEFLGRPEYDPHGDPIPSAGGSIRYPSVRRLSEARPGERLRIARVDAADREFLIYAARHQLMPDALISVQSVDAMASILTIKTDSNDVTLSIAAAGRIWVHRDG